MLVLSTRVDTQLRIAVSMPTASPMTSAGFFSALLGLAQVTREIEGVVEYVTTVACDGSGSNAAAKKSRDP